MVSIARALPGVAADTVDSPLLHTFSAICAGHLSPMCSVMGGIAAQEVLKGLTGKFMPIQQWLYFDALECLPDAPATAEAGANPVSLVPYLDEASVAPTGSRYPFLLLCTLIWLYR